MITFSGSFYSPKNGINELPTFRDIAVAYGRITKYSGSIWCPLMAHGLVTAEMAFLDSLGYDPGVIENTGDKDLPPRPLPSDDNDGSYRLWSIALLAWVHEAITGSINIDIVTPESERQGEQIFDDLMSGLFNLNPTKEDLDDVQIYDFRAMVAEFGWLELPNYHEYFKSVGIEDIPLSHLELLVVSGFYEGGTSFWSDPAVSADANRESVGGLTTAFEKIHLGDYKGAREHLMHVDKTKGSGLAFTGREDLVLQRLGLLEPNNFDPTMDPV